MPEIGRIQSTNFQSLLTELGITRNNIPFALRSEVTPVVLVGGTVSFVAAPTPPYRVTDIFTAGVQTNPAAGFVLADTGPLPIGAYTVQLTMVLQAEVNAMDLQWRDAPNAATLRFIRFDFDPDRQTIQFTSRFNVQNDNERFRVVTTGASGVGIEYYALLQAAI